MKELSYFEEQYNSAVASKDRLLYKTALCAFITLIFGGLIFANLPRIAYAVIQLIACGLIWAVCNDEITGGLRSFLKMNPTTDSFQALALIGATVHAIYMMFPDPADGHFFATSLFFSVTASMGMKLLYVWQIIKNLDLIRNKKTYALQVSDLTLSKKYIRQVCSANPVVDIPNIMRASYDADPYQKKNRKFVPLVALGVLAAAIVVTVFRKNMFFTALAAMLILCASFTSEMAFVLPYALMQIRLRKMGSILMGNHSVEHLKDTDTLLVKDTDLFPPEKNEILALRVHSKTYATEVVPYVSTLLKKSNSPLEEVFKKTTEALPRTKDPVVLQWRVIKNYGIVATINIDNVLLGNRNLLLSHNIQPWSTDKEAMLSAAGVHLMYLAINGEIAATLIFRYGPDPELKTSAELLGGEFNLLVDTKDCNICENMIQRHYELARTKISVPDPDEADSVNETREELEEDQGWPVMLSTQNALGILESIRQAKQLHKTVQLCANLQQLTTLLGVCLTFIALIIAPGKMSWLWPFAFNFIWALPVPIIALFRKD